MNKLVFLLILFLPTIGFGQDDYVIEKKTPLRKNNIKKENEILHKFSIAISFSASVNESESVPSGLLDSLNNHVNVNINGGNSIGLSIAYQLNNKMDIELGYNYVASGMEDGYFESGYGSFERNILTPMITYAPFNLKNHHFQFKGGINYVFKNAIIIDFDLPAGQTKIIYDYGKSTGFLLASEYEFRSTKLLSPRIGVLYTWNQFEFTEGTLNGQALSPKWVPDNTNSFRSSSLFLYFSLAINLKVKDNYNTKSKSNKKAP
jgi:hypothetical protein